MNRPSKRVAIAALAVTITACSGLTEVHATVPDQDAPDHLRVWFERYRDGTFLYGNERCRFVHPGAEWPGTEFACGDLSVGLQPGIALDEMADSFASIGGEVVRDLSGTEGVTVTLRVPARTEGSALLSLLTDDRLRHASLNFVEGSVTR
jgi:hypothetical protein